MKKKVLLSSIATIALCLCLIAGSTFALFTSKSEVNVAVTAGKVEVEANITDLTLYSVKANPTSGTVTDEYGYKYDYEKQDSAFINGGTATLVGNELTLDKVTPGDKVTFTIEIANASDVTTKYRTLVYCTANDGLLSGLEIGLDGNTFNGFAYTEWNTLAANADIADVAVTVELPVNAGNEYQASSASLCFIVEAVQSNGATAYDYLPDLDADGAYEIANTADLFIFAAKANDGTFAKGELTADIDLAGKVWMPIVHSDIEFDGQGHTISNLYAFDDNAAGLFGSATRSTISNVVIDKATVISNHYAAGIAAHALCTKIDNCTVKNSTITTSAEFKNNAWDNGDKAGAIAGYLSAEPTATVTNCTVENVTVKGYRDIGGVVGYANAAATIIGNTISDSTIICDPTRNYKNYNAADEFDVEAIVGEFNGGTVDASNTATNVEVVVPSTVLTVSDRDSLQAALDNAVEGDNIITLANHITGDVKATQKPNVNVIIEGNGYTFGGVLLVDGKSGTYLTAGLTVKNLKFYAESISADACVQLGNGTNATRYTCNVTLDGCTFDVPGAVGVKSYTGGDKNVSIINCTATVRAHSLAQLKGVDGVLVENCTVNSVRGINLNNSDNVVINKSVFDVEKYAVRFGESANSTVETFAVTNCQLTSDNVDGDAAIVLRAGATNANLTLTNTTITAGVEMSGHEGANIIR